MMLSRCPLVVLLLTALVGCGSDTAWYVCSGSAEFCSTDRSISSDKPVGVTAIVVAQSTPSAIESGLQQDALETTLEKSPELIGSWLIAGSLAVLTDDTDNAQVSRFLDDNRYWLTVNQDQPAVSVTTLRAGLALLAAVAAQRDPLVASAADQRKEKMLTLSPGVALETARPPTQALVAQAEALLSGYSPQDCCSISELMAAAVLLCEAPTLTSGAADNNLPNAEIEAACQAAHGWLEENGISSA